MTLAKLLSIRNTQLAVSINGCNKALAGLLVALVVMAVSPCAQFHGGIAGIGGTDDANMTTTDHDTGKVQELASLQPWNSARRDITLAKTEKGAVEMREPTLCHVNAQMNNKTLAPTSLIWKSQHVASAIFKKIGIQLTWRWDGRRPASKMLTSCRGASTASTLAVEIVPQAPANLSHDALAVATLSADSAVSIVVFYDRVVPVLRSHRTYDASILGYVLAHEIVHVLQGIPRHSETGAMRARWTEADYSKMAAGQLAFTAEDVRLIRSYFMPHQQLTRRGGSPCDVGPNSNSVAGGGTQ
jgi:hypothetical protein